MNVRLEEKLLREVEGLVESGLYASKSEAFAEALKLLLKAQKGKTIFKRTERIREESEAYPGASEALVETHKESCEN